MTVLAFTTSLLSTLMIVDYSTACRSTYHADASGRDIPDKPLGVCYDYKYALNDSYSVTTSYIYGCDAHGDLELQYFTGLQCTGNGAIYPNYDDGQSAIDCDGDECDYVLIRLSESINKCKSVSGQVIYATEAVIVNYCVQVDDVPFTSNNAGNWYLSARCNDTVAMHTYHLKSDCKDAPYRATIDLINGTCINVDGSMYYLEILNCSSSNIYDIHSSETLILTENIVTFVAIGIQIFVSLFITIKLFANLYQFKKVYFRNIPICFIISFSDKHNWLIEPTKSNKIYAIFTPIIYIMYSMCLAISWIVNMTQQSVILNGIGCPNGYICTFSVFYSCSVFGRGIYGIFTVLFMTSTVEYHMNHNEIIKQMISTKLIGLIKLIAILNGILNIAVLSIGFYYKFFEFLYQMLYIYDVLIILNELILAYLYYKGMNNLCHYWYSKQWKEYDKYGENERIHEILINISRITVVVTIFILMELSNAILNMIANVIDGPNINVSAFVEYEIFRSVFGTILFVPYIFSIYFIYPFGHRQYEKVYGKCQVKMYNYFQRKHRNQVDNGGFDGMQYRSSKWIKSNEMNQRIIDDNNEFKEEIGLTDYDGK